jgi:predicted HTH transcriptional regulator
MKSNSKKALSDRGGGQHPWFTGGDIGDHARNEILAEVIAFANAQGGSVVLGIEETPDKPPRAHAITPMPRVGELARRFEDQARSCIDPPLPRLQIRAIETDGQKGGVVVFRVSPSRAAPHRLTTTRESFVRRGSSSVRMTIGDIATHHANGLAKRTLDRG